MKLVDKVVAKLSSDLQKAGLEWMVERGRLCWARVKIKEGRCGGCDGTIKDDIVDILCVEFAFRKYCLDIYCLFCSRHLKRNGFFEKLRGGLYARNR